VREPLAPTGGPTYFVVPGDGGGSGTKADPYKGIAAADMKAKPGDTLVLQAGVYSGTISLRKSGGHGKPVVWRGEKDAGLDGGGHVVAYNRIHGFGDAMDTFQGPRCEAIDFHNNDCDLLTDDGCEMDYSQRNTRCFENRFTNVYQGISVQPVYGGPVYIFRN